MDRETSNSMVVVEEVQVAPVGVQDEPSVAFEASGFPLDFAREGLQGSGQRAQVVYTLPDALFRPIHHAFQEAPSVAGLILFSGVVGLLHQYSGHEHMAVGMVAPNGLLAIPMSISEEMTFQDLLTTVISSVRQAQTEQPNLPVKTAVLLESGEPTVVRAKDGLDVLFSFALPGTSLQLTVDYDPDLYQGRTIQQIVRHFGTFLATALEYREAHLGWVEILSDAERDQLLQEFNQTLELPAIDPKATIQQLFEQQAAQRPDQAAVVYRDQHLSYGELNAQVNALAHHLRQQGVQHDQVVGIMVTPSVEMLVGVLGILKSGAAYLPIDPEYPEERISYMLQDSGATLLLTQTPLVGKVPFAGTVLDLNDSHLYEGEIANPAPMHTANDLAYVIYTSGSTGKPKGVMIEHHSLVNLCLWHNAYYEVTANDRATKYAGFGFDASVWEVFPYLAAGATLHIIPEEMRLDVRQLNAYYEEQGVTISFLPTQICEQFMQLPNRSLRVLMTGGDKLRSFQPNRYKLYNNYGPSENTVVATATEIEQFSENIPIGKPIAGTRIYIVDRYDRLKPIGVEGELCISGNGIARGYRNLPEMTAEKFIADPFVSGAVMYRSGDRARWLPDGTIQFLGRVDDQVKINGMRIELEEIEAQLLKHPNIESCVIVVREGKSHQRSLIGYYVASIEIPPSDLRTYLAQSTPAAWIPSHFVHLTQMPLTPNGKVDKKGLPAPAAFTAAKDDTTTSMLSELERRLLGLWKEVLGIEQVGISDNFFDLGGNSLLLVTMHNTLEEWYPGRVSVADVFANPSILKLAAFLEQNEQPQQVAGLLFPDEFLAVDAESEDVMIQFAIPGEKYEALSEFATARELTLHTVLVSAYVYVLQQATELQEIHLHHLQDAQGHGVTLSFDFAELEDFETLFTLVSDRLQGSATVKGTRLQAVTNKHGRSVLPCFAYGAEGDVSAQGRVDLQLRVQPLAEELICTFEYDAGRLVPSKMEELVRMLMELLKMFITNR